MSNLFCCTTIQLTNLPNPDHDKTFTEFTKWALTTIGNLTGSTDPSEASVCIQLVRQVTSGPIESVRYFVGSDKDNFEEVSEDGILDANFLKMNECKSFRCTQHNRIFDLNLFEPSTGSARRWRSSIAKPLRQIENALKDKMSGSGSRSVSGSRSSMRSMGSGEQRTSASYGYGSGMGYGSGWGSHLGAGCGPNWGTGGSMVFVPASTTSTVVAGCNDCGSGLNRNHDHDHNQDQDQDQESDRNPHQDHEIFLPAGETEYADKDNNEDQPVPSSPTLGTEVTQYDNAGSYSPRYETHITSRDDEGAGQSYLNTEDYRCYYSGVSSDDYGSYDCGGGNDTSYDFGNYGDCGGWND
ncbi:hypothetical protein N7517_008699 [Penicillium concentricum]|uniref:Uncharacterized protein n=1 Tax=Penicillium concentricum TaxID=293559 RepID=A0A9W9V1X5_9EURO|nr:uncharacterized protein N7517_008699 [Penicillium concentricum]KAJ5365813.1 hypothetical protein N7517_008699 [Penicillium concentricum]